MPLARLLSALLFPLLASSGWATLAAAEKVLASEKVQSRVVLRERPSRTSPDVGGLRPGEPATLLGTLEEGGWHRVELADGSRGWVSAAWTHVEPDPPRFTLSAERVEETFPRSFLDVVSDGVAGFFDRRSPLELVIREPVLDGALHEHHDPELPVAGFAAALGDRGLHDVMIAIDASTSTLEFAEADVDGDGRAEDEWNGDDSIFRAELAAAEAFVRVLPRLPKNRDGSRIRIGIVSFAGEPPEQPAAYEASAHDLLLLAHRDARLHLPLTGDYEEALRTLESLREMAPTGSTDLAAGISRAMIELAGLDWAGAQSEARPDARRLVHLLTDGKPRLPVDAETAHWSAIRAAKLARRVDVRVHAFALGRNAVTREPSETLRRVAARSRGKHVALADPGDVVPILAASNFALVESVRVVNRSARGTRDDEAAIGIDGSFYGEVELAEGENEIEVVALMLDERVLRQRFKVDYRYVPPDAGRTERLAKIREENELLVDRLRERLAQRMQQERRAREGASGADPLGRSKVVELEAERPAVSAGP